MQTRPVAREQVARRHNHGGGGGSADERSRRRHARRHENMIIVADLARMRGGKDHSEISCCVKYTVFTFNVIFWVRSIHTE